MVRNWKHWCPSGCGLQVVYIGKPCKKSDQDFECMNCGKKYSKKQIDHYHNGDVI
ncbi:unnamed protein product [marine sediment metagenome]|uniref:C2H2-type domain-containing protein n=1 Tax=marine sediment metagenome TaxID=412755 RepID=X0XMX7_9ZZZZ